MNLESIYKKLQIQDMNQMQKSTYKATENKNDVVLLSPTGSGKTLAFLFPLLRNLKKDKSGIQALVLVPARELALQIEQVFKAMKTDYKVTVCYGGHDKKIETNSLTEAPALLIGTPGRIADHLRNNSFNPSTISTLILDEFDKSLEFGFQEEMSFIIESMKNLSQRILTSATAMEEIPSFTGLKNEKTIDFLKLSDVKPDIQFKKVITTAEEKLDALFHLICKIGNKRTLIFCNHREAADRISALLKDKGIERETFHGGMEQDERERALLKFRNDSAKILITTDLAARGLDIPEVESIVHYQLPPKEDAFIHRNGRTARMNAKGFAYLIMKEDDNFPFLKNDIPVENVEGENKIPQQTTFQTIYISAGKKDKVNKVDIVGYLIKKGELGKDDIGLIEVKDTTSYVAVSRKKIPELLKKLATEKLKGKKVKMEIAY
ncbi:DEAD/DEAH box helicase [Elizabethkingia anophelis]|uniref:DEAD/DEAH box helicase n=1 Tax=Elizabethkingia anophelis TaxID=1117645 RepID=UPI0021A422AC|nr:DEAD/DEAH box helicase [Elizabethkingia anophelis]MCT3663604.1 DEAD/DEAH box helicase [Elizabethkingia anophelis]MCT3905634.1 DEAD/DEAH box helicase [Elizabethkingia anophelis]MCT4329743.1 DEAD/DEAH box helicase [Elizabethkingia anophelis]CAH1144768.1 ATP-dependent RNA helicase DbpA [Elizabethkingia anophelis]CAI9677480.1 ATP-dependent RNA helicase DbpA [Elizabethkingia anophelis]